MALNDIVRSGVAIANALTSTLQATVTHEPWTLDDDDGRAVYGAPVSRPAIVEARRRRFAGPGGEAVEELARVTFVGPVEAHGAEGRREPIDPRDRLTLPDGTSGPILTVEGLADPSTARPYLYVVTVGA